MDIHEYQAKELLANFGVAIPPGGVAYSAEQAVYRAAEIGGSRWAVKAQIHSGARGKAGGIKLCTTEDEVRKAADALLGPACHSPDGARGESRPPALRRSGGADRAGAYIGFVLDRKTERIMLVAHPHGGMEIEEIAKSEPETILRQTMEPAVGMQAFQAREIAYGLGLDPPQVNRMVNLLLGVTGRSAISTPPWWRSIRWC